MPLDPVVADRLIEALRIGDVPELGLEAIGTGIDAQLAAFEREFPRIERGDGRIRFVRGDFGTGKTFFLKSLGARARAAGFATAYLRISYPDLPLGNPAALYAAITRELRTRTRTSGAFRDTIDAWLYRAIERVGDPRFGETVTEDDPGFTDAVERQLRTMLGALFDGAPLYAQIVSAYARALDADEPVIARGLLQWLGGDEHVDASVKRYASVRGKLGQLDAIPLIAGLSTVLTQSNVKGLVVLVDEVERVLHQPQNVRAVAYRTLQNLIGELHGNLHGVLFVVAGTTAFFDHRKGIGEVEPLRQRIETTFDDAFPDLEAVQVKLPPFDRGRLVEVGTRIVDVYVDLVQDPTLRARVDAGVVEALASDVIGAFGGDIAIAPRQFFRRLVSILSKAKNYPSFDPRADRLDRTSLAADASLSELERARLTDVEQSFPLEL